MDEIVDYVMPLMLMLALICMAEIVTVYGFYKQWIKEGKTVEFIPEWKDTKKPFYWFLGWSIAKSVTDVIVIIVFVLMVPIDRPAWFILMPFAWFVAFFFEMIFYVICETIVIKRIRRKNVQSKSQMKDTQDVVVDESDSELE
ncbi:MAG: hypothetical protein K2I75_04950 [Clostridiales bacterium]|nr:hypothetical protein [Clostridiales bacterium]